QRASASSALRKAAVTDQGSATDPLTSHRCLTSADGRNEMNVSIAQGELRTRLLRGRCSRPIEGEEMLRQTEIVVLAFALAVAACTRHDAEPQAATSSRDAASVAAANVALLAAAKRGDTSAVGIALTQGADPNARTPTGATALMVAAD